MRRNWIRWTPAAVAVVAVAGAAIVVPLAGSAAADVTPKTAHQVLQLLSSSKVHALSGTVAQTSDLGLPSLPTSGPGSNSDASNILDLVTGDHTAMVYVDGAKKERIQLLDSLAERDVIRNGKDVWVYDSKKNTVEHGTVTARTHGVPKSTKFAHTPSDVAKTLVTSLKSSSTLTLGPAKTIASRAAYDLVLAPKATDTLLGSVSVYVDEKTGLPLEVDVMARGSSSPAISIGYTQLTLGAPAATVFQFTAPKGAKVTQLDATHAAKKSTTKPKASDRPRTTVTGTGWDAVVTLTGAKQISKLESNALFTELTTSVTGGRLLHTSLVNVLIENDGRILVGSVSPSRLEAVASGS